MIKNKVIIKILIIIITKDDELGKKYQFEDSINIINDDYNQIIIITKM